MPCTLHHDLCYAITIHRSYPYYRSCGGLIRKFGLVCAHFSGFTASRTSNRCVQNLSAFSTAHANYSETKYNSMWGEDHRSAASTGDLKPRVIFKVALPGLGPLINLAWRILFMRNTDRGAGTWLCHALKLVHVRGGVVQSRAISRDELASGKGIKGTGSRRIEGFPHIGSVVSGRQSLVATKYRNIAVAEHQRIN